MRDYKYFKQALESTRKPCAFLDLTAFKNNIKEIEAKAQTKKIRIASKSIRSVEALRLILDTSDVFQGVMCFTAEEALFLDGKGMDDLLIAYPVWDEKQLTNICLKVKQGAQIIVMIDSKTHIDHLESIATDVGGSFLVCLDIDLSSKYAGLHFGVYRSSVHRIKDALRLVKRLKKSDLLTLDGVMGYEAQIAGVTDQDPEQKVKSSIVRLLKRRSVKEIAKKRTAIVEAVEKELDRKLRFVNGGGTGSLATTGKETGVTEMTAGSGFYNPHLFDKYAGFQYEPAAGYAVEITRIPKSHIYTCLGGGYTASGAAGKDRLPEIYLPEGASLIDQEGVGEVQTPFKYKGSVPLTYGDPIFMRHSKAGELCERFHALYVIEDGSVVDTFSTYRGEGKCFL